MAQVSPILDNLWFLKNNLVHILVMTCFPTVVTKHILLIRRTINFAMQQA
jgi:hypothetical protein